MGKEQGAACECSWNQAPTIIDAIDFRGCNCSGCLHAMEKANSSFVEPNHPSSITLWGCHRVVHQNISCRRDSCRSVTLLKSYLFAKERQSCIHSNVLVRAFSFQRTEQVPRTSGERPDWAWEASQAQGPQMCIFIINCYYESSRSRGPLRGGGDWA